METCNLDRSWKTITIEKKNLPHKCLYGVMCAEGVSDETTMRVHKDGHMEAKAYRDEGAPQ